MNRKIFHSNVFPAFIMWRESPYYVYSLVTSWSAKCVDDALPTSHCKFPSIFLLHESEDSSICDIKNVYMNFFHKACDATLCYSIGSILCNSSSIRASPVGSLSGGSFLQLIIADKERESSCRARSEWVKELFISRQVLNFYIKPNPIKFHWMKLKMQKENDSKFIAFFSFVRGKLPRLLFT